MALEISGKIITVLTEQTGSGKNGVWVRQDFVVETEEQYPKKVCFSAWGDKAAQVKTLQPGQQVKVSFNVESREFNGKWYTDLRIWKLDTQSSKNSQSSNNDFPDYGNSIPGEPMMNDPEGDLPF